ncbi:MAG: metallophosphoesterase family protein [Candidatus Lokiarchaeota archaeon]|nr:metallophosphoesterase family protein [Candidatus Lokiarchaeota archaeon]
MIKTNKDQLLIGLIGDTHMHSQEGDILQKILDNFKEKEIDYLFHVGDFTSYKIYEKLQALFGREKVIGIVGNMDGSKISKELPKKIELDLFGHRIFITHGEGGPDNIIKLLNKRFDLSQYDIIIFGHAHHPFNEKGRDGKLYISPGSPTDKRFTDINSYGYLKISQEKLEPKIIYL